MPEIAETEEELELLKKEVADEENVEDDPDAERQAISRFTITSYGADYTVDSLVKRLRDESFFVPPFQRLFVWNQRQASRFVESLLMGLPVPGIFVFREAQTNKHLIIDGQQRLNTLKFFYDGTFKEKVFRLQDVRAPWSGDYILDLASVLPYIRGSQEGRCHEHRHHEPDLSQRG